MDPQQPVIQPVESIISPTSPQLPLSPKSSNSLTVISMALFILLSLGAVAFLYYQNQQLKTMLASYQTSVASPTSTPTADPTANWKTFSASFGSIKYTFKYPQNLNPLITENGSVSFFEKQDDQVNCEKIFKGLLPMSSNSPCLNNFLTISITVYTTKDFDSSGINPKSGTNSPPIVPKILTDNQGRTWQTDMVLGEVFNFTGITTSDENTYVVGIQSGFGQEADNGISFRNLANQILSTFKFLEATPSSSPSASPTNF